MKKEPTKLESLIHEEKRLTADWYLMMSGQRPWPNDGRSRINATFDRLDTDIKTLQREEVADWFATLP